MAQGAAKVYKLGLKTAATYRSKCLGMPEGRLQRPRREAGRFLPGGAGSNSLTLQMALCGGDPIGSTTAAAPMEWARAVWDGTVEAAVLARAWRRQQVRVGLVRSWARVVGPAGATIMSLRRARWTWPAWHTYVTRGGFELDMREVCPQDVAATLQEDLDWEMWAVWTSQP